MFLLIGKEKVMEQKNNRSEQPENPGKTFGDELREKGSTFTDTPRESDARDKAKMVKSDSPESQKLDGNNPFAEEDTVSDEEIHKETYDDHK
jgi:hypothetical protein